MTDRANQSTSTEEAVMRPMSDAPTHDGAKVLLVVEDEGERMIVEAALVHGIVDYQTRAPLPPQWCTPYDVWGGNTLTDYAIGWLPYPDLTLPERSE